MRPEVGQWIRSSGLQIGLLPGALGNEWHSVGATGAAIDSWWEVIPR
jgi:hypothetical protein